MDLNPQSRETIRRIAHSIREAGNGFQKKADRLEEWASGLREATDNTHRNTESASDPPEPSAKRRDGTGT